MVYLFQEVFVMKKVFSILLVLCLVLSIAAGALAAGKPEITGQPKSATTTKKGQVSFSIKVKANGSSLTYTWYFVNPQTGERISAKKLDTVFKQVKVANPNSKKVTLKKVPDEMHGWQVYCHITGNGYKLDSELVVLGIYGKEPPPEPVNSQPEAPAADGVPGSVAPQDGTASQTPGLDIPLAGDDTDPSESDEPQMEVEHKPVTVTSSDAVLYKIDSFGNPVSETPISSITFSNSGSFLVRADEPLKSWTVNGMRFEPAEPVREFRVYNVSDNMTLNVSVVKKTAATAEVDTSKMCKVTCTGCTFSYMPDLVSVTSGEVPSGAFITVIGNSDNLASGYSVNGGEVDHVNLASFRLTVTEDTNIVMPEPEPTKKK